jgi:hypothetical protein
METNEAIRMIDQLMSGETALETIEDVDAYVAKFAAHLENVRWGGPTIAERRVYDQHVARLRASRQASADRRQARVNAREVAAVRSAACPRCFSTHRGEC